MRSKKVLLVMSVVAALMLAALVSVVSADSGGVSSGWSAPGQSELRRTIPPGRTVKVRIEGTITAMAGSDWTIEDSQGNSFDLEVTGETHIVEAHGQAEVGARVWVLAQVRSGEPLLALTIIVREPRREQGEPFHFSGIIDSLPADGLEGMWVVGAYEFEVTDGTSILPEEVVPEVGDWVRVNVFRQPDDSLWAKKVMVLQPEEDGIGVCFAGIIEEFPAGPPYVGDWLISGIPVTATETTLVVGVPEVGLRASVKGVLQEDGTVLGTKIEVCNAKVKPIRFRGIIGAFPAGDPPVGEWLIGDLTVIADGDTEITGTPALGLQATGRGWPQPDGSVLALSIEVDEDPPPPEEVTFDGVIEKLPKRWRQGVWIVSGMRVHVTSRTVVTGPEPTVGATVHGTGRQAGDQIHASEIEVE